MALTARGFEVVLADAAEALLVQARQRLPEARALLGDLSELKLNREIDVVACRGVLNDVIDDADRDAVLAAFARALRPGGAVVIDVREELATMARYAGGRRTLREAGGVVFTSEGVWQDGVVAVVERHEAQGRVAEHTAVFRPWSRDELRDRLVTAGFTVDTIATGRVEHRADRLIAIARWNG
jgi:SAM-dependent methyltransferase